MKKIKNFFEAILAMQYYNCCRKHDKAAHIYEECCKLVPDDEYLKNRFLNEYEISLGKYVLKSKPQSIQFVLFDKCNSGCIMCNQKKENYFLSEKYLTAVLSEYLPYLNTVLWQGGEIFLWDKFTDLLKYVSSYKIITQSIITNAQCFNEELIRQLVSLKNIRLIISVDSCTKQKYEYIRKGSCFEKLLKNTELINKYKTKYKSDISLNINFVMMKENYDEIVKMPDFAKKYNFDSLTFNECIPTDKYSTVFDVKTKKSIDAALGIAVAKALKYGIRVTVQRAKERNVFKNSTLLCKLPWTKIWFGEYGFFAPECVCLQKQYHGNKDFPEVSGIWNGRIMQEYRRHIFDNKKDSVYCSPQCRLYGNKSVN